MPPPLIFGVIGPLPHPDLIQSLAEGAAALGGELDLDALGALHLTEDEGGRDWAGVFVCGSDPDTEIRIGRMKCPVVRIAPCAGDDSPPTPAHGARVECSRTAAGAAAAAHLLSLGTPGFAFCHTDHGLAADTLWNAFEPPLVSAGGRVERIALRSAAASKGERLPRERRIAILTERLESLPGPLAILAQDMSLALDIVTACARREWAVPEDIAVLSLGGNELAEAASPVPISVVNCDLRALGRRAAARMGSLALGAPDSAEPGGGAIVIARDSTATHAGRNRFAAEALRMARKEFRRNELTADTVAARLGLSRTGLQKIMLRETGRSLSDEIRRLRVEECCRMLSCGSLKLGSIAAECGLTDAKNLCRVFRKAKGMTPAQWRRITARQDAPTRSPDAPTRVTLALAPGESRSKSR